MNEHRVVAQLQTFLDSGSEVVSEELKDLAHEYTRLCRETNERLGRCGMYIAQGLRTEAIHLAEQEPPVLDLAAALEFKSAPAWRDFCRTHGWPMPAAPATDVISRLNEAYMMEEALATLMAEYRRMARTGTAYQRIGLLRRLAYLDKNNPNWREDLANLERLRHRELQSEANVLLKGEDAAAMAELLRELDSPEWMVSPPPTLAESLKKRLLALRASAAARQAEQIAQAVSQGYSSFDMAWVRGAIQKWDRLVASEPFVPASELVAQVAEAREWLAGELRKQLEQAEFQHSVKTLAKALDDSAPLAEIERCVYQTNRFNRDVPEALRSRIQRALADGRLAETRRFRMRVGVIALLVAAIVVPVFLLIRAHLRAVEQRDWYSRIDTARAEQKFDAAHQLQGELKRRQPGWSSQPAFQELDARIQSEEVAFAGERKAFDRTMQDLADIRNAGFPADRPYASLEQRAARLARMEVERMQLEEWRTASKAHEYKVQSSIDAQLREHVRLVVDRLKQIAPLNPETDSAAFVVAVKQAAADLAAAHSMQNASPALLAQLEPLDNQVKVYLATATAATERESAANELMARIDAALPDLDRCEQLIAEFAKSYPNRPENARLQSIARDCRIGRSLIDGQQFAAFLGTSQLDMLQKFVTAPESKASIWWAPLNDLYLRCATAESGFKESREALEKLALNWRVCDLYTCTARDLGTNRITRYYYRDEPVKKWEASANDASYSMYTFHPFQDGHKDESSVSIGGAGQEVNMSATHADNLAPHCRVVRALLSEFSRASGWTEEEILLRTAAQIHADPNVDPIMKVVLLRLLLGEARKITASNLTALDGVLKEMEALNTNIYWMDFNAGTDVQKAREATAKTLKRLSIIPTLAARQTVGWRLTQQALTRQIRCVGAVTMQGKSPTFMVSRGKPQELWIVVSDTSGHPMVYLAGATTEDGAWHVENAAQNKLYAGQPLFAPTDGRATAELLRTAVEGVPEGAEALKEMVWPVVWPMNQHTLSAPVTKGQ